MDIIFQQINRERVSPLVVKEFDPKKVKGHKLFAEPYCNIFLCARKMSGKTTVINTILEKTVDKRATVYIFASTHMNDDAWGEIKNRLSARGIDYKTYASIKEGKNNFLKTILEELKEEEDESEEAPKPKLVISVNEPEEEEKEEKKKIYKKIAPEVVFIFDDLGDQINDKMVTQLLKTNRHYKSKVIISTQYPKDIPPAGRRQIDYWLCFQGIPEERIEVVHKDSGSSLSFDQFYKLYKLVTNERYSFLYIDTKTNRYRKNFDMALEVRSR